MDEPGFFPIRKLAIIGLGLIGGSLAIDLRRLGLVTHILGYDSNPQHCEIARSRQFADVIKPVPDENLTSVDWLVFALPVKVVESVLEQCRSFLKPGVMITDTGSVKSSIMDLMQQEKNRILNFIGGHPIAGSERFGPEAAKANLFNGKQFVVTPGEHTSLKNLQAVKQLWTQLGCRVTEMSAKQHDRIFASVSHLPHLLAYASIQAITDSDSPESLGHSGAGLKDFSRIASSSPEMWADIFLQNKEELIIRVDALIHRISEIKDSMQQDDREKLIELLTEAKASKDLWVK